MASNPTLMERMIAGAGWTLASRAAIRLIGLVSIVVLARLLQPSDYGLIAIATAITASVELLASFNFDVWLIRHAKPEANHYNTVWTLSVVSGLATCLVLAVAAEPLSALFNEPRLATVLYVLAGATAFGALRNVGIVDFQKHLQFQRDFAYFALTKLGSFLAALIVAVLLRNYWALLAGIVAGHVLGVALSYRMHSFRPRFALTNWLEAFHFSKWLLATNLFALAYQRSDTFILGKIGSSETLGVYSMAHEIANLTSSEFITPLRRVMLPGYAKLADDPTGLARAFVDGFALIVLVGLPAALGVGLLADPLVRTLLGERWLACIPLVQILALYGIASVGLANQGPVLVALGHTRLVSVLTGLGVALLIPAFLFATMSYGVLGGAWAVAMVNAALFCVSFTVTVRIVRIALATVLGQCWRAVVCAIVMAIVVVNVQTFLGRSDAPAPVVLMLCAAVGALVYAAGVWVVWRLGGGREGPERFAVDLVLRWMASRRAP